MSSHEMSAFMVKSGRFLYRNLNFGSFEGITGSSQDVLMDLNLAFDLVYIMKRTTTPSKQLAYLEVFKDCETSQHLRSELKETLDYLLLWLFLNARTTKDETPLLGNASANTPSTQKVSQITKAIEEMLLGVATDYQNE